MVCQQVCVHIRSVRLVRHSTTTPASCRQQQHLLSAEGLQVVHQLVRSYQAECAAVGRNASRGHKVALTHECRSTACDSSNCVLCRNALVKQCTGLVKKRYRDVEQVQALCKGLLQCTLEDVPGSVTGSVTNFRVGFYHTALSTGHCVFRKSRTRQQVNPRAW
jgi:hypothetical protein